MQNSSTNWSHKYSLGGLVWLVALSLVYFGLSPALVKAEESKANHLYVIRRPLDAQPVTSIRKYAHSALLVQTTNGKFYVLEYMADSKAHLTETEMTEVSKPEAKKIAIVKVKGMTDGGVKELEWERQLSGSKLEPKWSPVELRDKMQTLMKEYSIWKEEYCHSAQERLRRELGLKVD